MPQSNSEPISSSSSSRGMLPILKVIGLGGGGQNAIDRMIELGREGVDFIAANSDAQVLRNSLAPVKIQLGPKVTHGQGAGGDPTLGEFSAEESYQELQDALRGADMVFLTCGMGGGTGTGAIPVAANIAKEQGAVVVAVVTTPFSFEMGRRQANARAGIAKLRPYTDTMITVSNDRLLQIAPKDLPLEMAFRLADDILRQGIQGISELVYQPGLINVDFSHIRNVLKHGGRSLISIGTGSGENRISDAVEYALHHPMLENIPLENTNAVIANFTSGDDLPFHEVVEALQKLHARTGDQAQLIPGVIRDPRMEERVQVILVLTGLDSTPESRESIRQSQPATFNPDIDPTPVETAFPFLMQEPNPDHSLETTELQSEIEVPTFIRRRLV